MVIWVEFTHSHLFSFTDFQNEDVHSCHLLFDHLQFTLIHGPIWVTSLSLFTFMHWRRKWQPTPVFLPKKSQRQESLVGCPSMGLHRVGHDWSDLAAWTYAGSYTILFLTASDFSSITSHIHNWVLFSFWLIPSFFQELFLHSSPVEYWASTNLGSSSSSVVIFSPSLTVHGVVKARIVKWFASPFSSGPHFVHYDLSILGGPTQHDS